MPKIDLPTDRENYAVEYTKSDTDRGVFFGNAVIDSLFTAVTVLGAEVWALRKRAKITEKLLEEKKGAITVEMIQRYVPTAEENVAWGLERNELVASIFSSFTRQGDIPYASTLSTNDPDKND
jgi:hypothetical protein